MTSHTPSLTELYAAAARADKNLLEMFIADLPVPEAKAALARHKAYKEEVKEKQAAWVKSLRQFPKGATESEREIIRQARVAEAASKVALAETATAEARERLNDIFANGADSD
jgi:hypothetical protein